jgi:multidrug efflux pump subunit AcrA (membrane-fusion protein)
VLAVGADNLIVRRNVAVGGAHRDGLLVSGGLTDGERVVAAAGAFLREGEKVIVAASDTGGGGGGGETKSPASRAAAAVH